MTTADSSPLPPHRKRRWYRTHLTPLYEEIEAMVVGDCLRWTAPRRRTAGQIMDCLKHSPRVTAKGMRRLKFVTWRRTLYIIRVQ